MITNSSYCQHLETVEAVTISYTSVEDPDLRGECEAGWLMLTDLKCCRLVSLGLSWQVETARPRLGHQDQREFSIRRQRRSVVESLELIWSA